MLSTPELAPEILKILRCPVTGSQLQQEGEELVAVGDPAYRYTIDRGVPHLVAAR